MVDAVATVGVVVLLVNLLVALVVVLRRDRGPTRLRRHRPGRIPCQGV